MASTFTLPEMPILDFKSDVLKVFCPICLERFGDYGTFHWNRKNQGSRWPFINDGCGHSICQACVKELQSCSTACPVCRQDTPGCSWIKNKAAEDLIDVWNREQFENERMRNLLGDFMKKLEVKVRMFEDKTGEKWAIKHIFPVDRKKPEPSKGSLADPTKDIIGGPNWLFFEFSDAIRNIRVDWRQLNSYWYQLLKEENAFAKIEARRPELFEELYAPV